MRFCSGVACVAVGCLLICPAVVLAADSDAAAKSFAQGTELVKKGDFDAALKSYAAAARADGDNEAYRQQYMLVRRVTKMRSAIMKETNAKKWWQMAVALRDFYYQYQLYDALLSLAKQMHEKEASVGSATILADAYLSSAQNAEAEKVLAALDKDKLTPQAKVLLGIALARQKKIDQAKAVLKEISIPEKSSPRYMVDVARLKVLCGDASGGNATLATAFESTVPHALDAFKAYAIKSPDFASVAGTEDFAKVLKTASKVTESSCSGGSSCGTCPTRGSCSASGQSCAQAAGE